MLSSSAAEDSLLHRNSPGFSAARYSDGLLETILRRATKPQRPRGTSPIDYFSRTSTTRRYGYSLKKHTGYQSHSSTGNNKIATPMLGSQTRRQYNLAGNLVPLGSDRTYHSSPMLAFPGPYRAGYPGPPVPKGYVFRRCRYTSGNSIAASSLGQTTRCKRNFLSCCSTHLVGCNPVYLYCN